MVKIFARFDRYLSPQPDSLPMSFILQPWQFLLIVLAGWINRDQQATVEYLRAENRVLKELLGKKRVLLNDDQRRRLAVPGKVLGLRRLRDLAGIVTPETILRWHRQLIAAKWDHSAKRKQSVGRPAVTQEIADLVLRFARENLTWGYDRIQGAFANLGHTVSDQSVGNILKEHGIEPAPERKQGTSWETFLKAHWESLGAIDFTTVEVWTMKGLVTMYILVVMELKTRRIEIAGVTANPDGKWIRQVCRNLTEVDHDFLRNRTHLLVDRDTKLQPLREYLAECSRVKPVLLPPRSPNLNSYIERLMRSLKSETVSRMIFYGEGSLCAALKSKVLYYHSERNHQGLENKLIDPVPEVGSVAGKIECRERLGGLLRYYHLAA